MAHRKMEREREAVTFLRRLPELLLLAIAVFGLLSLVQWAIG